MWKQLDKLFSIRPHMPAIGQRANFSGLATLCYLHLLLGVGVWGTDCAQGKSLPGGLTFADPKLFCGWWFDLVQLRCSLQASSCVTNGGGKRKQVRPGAMGGGHFLDVLHLLPIVWVPRLLLLLHTLPGEALGIRGGPVQCRHAWEEEDWEWKGE